MDAAESIVPSNLTIDAVVVEDCGIEIISEGFEDGSWGEEFVLGENPGGASVDFNGAFSIVEGTGSSVYLASVDSDFRSKDFIFRAEVTIPSTSAWSYPFFGMGNPIPSLSYYLEPSVPNLLMVLSSYLLAARDNTVDGGGVINYGQRYTTLVGTYGLEMKWNAATGMAEFSFDFQNDGTVDQTFSLNGSDNGFTDTNSTLILGGGNGVTFDNIQIRSVSEVMAPEARCRDITIALGPDGTAVITPEEIDNGSVVGCGSVSLSLDVTHFGCEDVGVNPVMLTVVDALGNSASFIANVTVVDDVPPLAVARNVDLELDAFGQAVIDPTDIDAGSGDLCGIGSMSLSQTEFGCADLGDNLVVLTVVDVHGNQSTATATLRVEDNQAPSIVVSPITISLDANGQASIEAQDVDGGSSDNCGIASMSLDMSQFDCSDVGVVTVVLTVTDVNGNVATSGLGVTVQLGYSQLADASADELAGDKAGNMVGIHDGYLFPSPGMIDGITVRNDSDHTQENITLLILRPEGNDAFRIIEMIDMGMDDMVPASTGTSFYGLDTPIQVMAGDTFGHWGPGTSGAVPLNNIFNPPSDDTYYGQSRWSQTGTLIAIEDMVVGGSFTASRSRDPMYRDYFINLSFTPLNEAQVTVIDDLPPVVQTVPVTLSLDRFGNGTLSPEMVNNGSSDNCGIASMQLDKSKFGCADIGENPITLTVTDSNGNTSSNITIVTVIDDTAPVVSTRNVTLELDEAGVAVVAPGDIDNGSTDNCGNASITYATFRIVDSTPPVLFSNDLRDVFLNEVPISFSVESSDACGEAAVQITEVTRHKLTKKGKIIFLDEESTSEPEDLPAIVIEGDRFTLNDSDGAGTIVTVYATATDDCGNTTDGVFTINVLKPGKLDTQSE